MSPRLRRSALCLALLSLPALAAPPRDDRRSARIRNPHPSPTPRSEPSEAAEASEVEPSETSPGAAAAADVGGVDLAGLLGMVTALAATFVYARGRRLSTARRPSRAVPGSGPQDPR